MTENKDSRQSNGRPPKTGKRSVAPFTRKEQERIDPAEAAMNRNPNPSPPLVFETPAAES
jgi:hypothetical protein